MSLELPDLPTSLELPSLPSLPELPKLPSLDSIKDITTKFTMPKIATSIFSTGPKDEVATADIYSMVTGGKGKSPFTSIQELDLLPDTSLFDKLDGSSTADFLSKAQAGLKFDTNLLTNRLLGMKGEFKAQFGALTDGMKKGALLDTFKDKAKYCLSTIKDARSLVKAAKIGDVKALGSFVNSFSGKSIFSGTDKGALAGLLGSVVKTSSDLGITGVFSTLADTVNDKGIVGKITRSLLPIVVKNADAGLLKELTSGSAGKLINVISPGFTQAFTKNFTYKGTNTKTLNSFEDILTSFKNIDGGWDKINRGGGGNTATNLLSLLGSSKDFQNLLSTGVKYWSGQQSRGATAPVPIDPMHMLATMYSEVPVGKAISRDFPKVALLNLYNGKLPRSGTRSSKNKIIVDARMLNGVIGTLFGA